MNILYTLRMQVQYSKLQYIEWKLFALLLWCDRFWQESLNDDVIFATPCAQLDIFRLYMDFMMFRAIFFAWCLFFRYVVITNSLQHKEFRTQATWAEFYVSAAYFGLPSPWNGRTVEDWPHVALRADRKSVCVEARAEEAVWRFISIAKLAGREQSVADSFLLSSRPRIIYSFIYCVKLCLINFRITAALARLPVLEGGEFKSLLTAKVVKPAEQGIIKLR